jgi:glycosyltransferase involved in cell wall biosynthesis
LDHDLTENTNKSKKIEMIAFLNAYSEGLTGSDLRFVEIANRINKERDAKLTIVTSKLGKELCETRGLKATFNVTSNEEKLGNIPLIYFKRIFSALIRRFEINVDTVLYATSDFLPDVFPIYLLKLKNKRGKWVQLIHHIQKSSTAREGKRFSVNLLGFLSQRLSFALLKKCSDMIIVVNPVIKKQLLNEGFNGKKVFVNYNGVDLKKIRDIKSSNVVYDCVFLGRLNVSKGLFDLVKVWSYVVAKNINAKLAIIGKGGSQIEKQLRNYISDMQLKKNIDLCGFLDDVGTFGTLKSAKVFLFPSYEEGFGIAILEAMACGLPVVAYDLPVYRKIFGDKLITVPLGRTDLLSESVVFLLENPPVASSMGKEGVALANCYDWSKIAQREILLIESLNDNSVC